MFNEGGFVGKKEVLTFLDIYSENPHIKFPENVSSGSRVVPCGRWTDGHETNSSRFSQFCECT
jgi:hypothetical protein